MQFELLEKICKEHPYYIPIDVAADFLHIRATSLRACIDQGRCPFGFSWVNGNRSGYKVPTLTFVAWISKGVFPLPNS